LNLRPRRREDPEINLINFIDVLLVLLNFFMVSTTFNQEGRVKVQLPQASAIPQPRATHEPLVITVTAEGGYRLNERPLINSSPDTFGPRSSRRRAPTADPSPSARTRAALTRRWSPRWT
jgi:biopolymer transport protein ExbD